MTSKQNADWLRFYDDIYDSRVQQILYNMLHDGTESREDVISYILQIDKNRREIQYGQYRRIKLEPATKFEWKDPRKADGVPILARNDSNEVKINHRSHTAFSRYIVSNKKSYFIGEEPQITASDKFTDWMDKNSFHSVLSEVVDDSVSQGEAFTLLYSPQNTNEAFITREQPYNCVVIYHPDTGRPAYGLIYMFDTINIDPENSAIIAYFYDESTVHEYEGTIYAVKGKGEEIRHLFSGVPLIEWRNNSERISDIEPVLNSMDLYDIMDSDFLSELSQLRLAYLFLKKMGLADSESGDSPDSIAESIKRAGYFASDEDDSEVKFVSKDINYEAVQYAKANLKERIFQMANSYDPATVQGADSNVTAFQIRMKLFPLEQSTKETEIFFTKAFMYMYELLSDFYSSFNDGLGDEDVSIEFKRNVPSNIMQDIIDARAGGFRMSQEQIAKRLPFKIDQEENADQLEQESESVMIEP